MFMCPCHFFLLEYRRETIEGPRELFWIMSYVILLLSGFVCRHQLQAGNSLTPLQEAGMENRIQVLKGPFNILQLAQDKRAQFASPGLFTFNHVKLIRD